MIKFFKFLLRPLRDNAKSIFIEKRIRTRIDQQRGLLFDSFNFQNFQRNIINFIQINQVEQKHYLYKYSDSCTKPTLYASAYALMTLSLLGNLEQLAGKEKDEWRKYFDSHQSETDGLFYDPTIANNIYNDSDWWGARHLALHLIRAYTDFGVRPRYQFLFLKNYYETSAIQKWLDQFDWQSASIGAGDIDNKIMNVGCLLQYQRDYWGDAEAGKAVELLKEYLRKKINQETGLWGIFNFHNRHQRSRMVQFAYHILPIFFYDKEFDFNAELIVTNVLNTQNKIGGYGVQLNSSACEDIDSIYILLKMEKYCSHTTQIKISKSINKAFNWVMLNQVSDGGFVFRLDEPFLYGSVETSSSKNIGAMFPTWFRTLSLAYMANYLGHRNCFKIVKCPGYEF